MNSFLARALFVNNAMLSLSANIMQHAARPVKAATAPVQLTNVVQTYVTAHWEQKQNKQDVINCARIAQSLDAATMQPIERKTQAIIE